MRTKTLAACALAALAFTSYGAAQAKGGSHSVSGHTTKSGTYVAPHQATNPNSTKADNYSSKGNVNPHTGKEGTKDPYAPAAPKGAKP
jgi:hypothetical protein